MPGNLTPIQAQQAQMIYSMGRARGLTDEQAKEVVASSYAESKLDPHATNPKSGAAGLFQLLSPGYRQTATKLGGVYDPRANTAAILPSFQQFFAQHPGAAPGVAGTQVERSGEGPGFYSSPLSLFSGLGGGSSVTSPGAAPPGRDTSTPAAAGAPSQAFTLALINSLQSTAAGRPLNLTDVMQHSQAASPEPVVAPEPTAAAANHGMRRGNLDTPINYTKVIGYPDQGTHAVAFNKAHGSDNWESENAVDLAAPAGSPVYAVSSGTIGQKIGALGSSDPRMAGQRLHLVTDGNEFYYAHLSRIVVKAGQKVKAGQLLGYSGSANGVAHLHLASEHGDPLAVVGKK